MSTRVFSPRFRLYLQLLIEMGRRVQPQGFWSQETADYASEAGEQACYCLDAPDEAICKEGAK